MSDVTQLPPPRRFLVEYDEGSEGDAPKLEEVTGTEDPCYMVGLESPWLGCSLEEIEGYARAGEYGPLSYLVVAQCAEVRRNSTNPQNSG